MPRPKQMIKTAEVEIALRQRTCAFSKMKILQGTACLVVYEGDRDRFCYSREIALRMIEQGHERLDELEKQLNVRFAS
jgi:hypothetical protein